MSTTFSWPGGSIEASCDISSLSTSRGSRVVVHEVLDGPPVYTARQARSRESTLKIYCTTHADARLLEDAYAAGFNVETVDTAAPALIHVTIATGDIELTRNPRAGWVLEVDVSEVDP